MEMVHQITDDIPVPTKSAYGWKQIPGQKGKLIKEEVEKIHRLRKEGLTCRAIAKQMNQVVSYKQIHKIVTGQCWKDI
jgi:hypothetical protein